MNARQIKAYHELMDYIDRQDYSILMRDENGKFKIKPNFNHFHRQKVLGFDQRLGYAVKDAISKSQLSNKEILELERFIKCSSFHVNEACFDDLKLPHFLTLLGMLVLIFLSYTLFFIECDLDIHNIVFNYCFERSSFIQKFFTYVISLYISLLIWATVRRRSIVMKISNHKLLLAEHLKNISN